MGRRPLPVRWNGHCYPNAGWAVGDALVHHPEASDQQLSQILNIDVSRIQYWREKAGIAEYRKRKIRPFLTRWWGKTQDRGAPRAAAGNPDDEALAHAQSLRGGV